MVQAIGGVQRAPSPVGRGRVVPHDLHAEESLLGAMLLSRDAIVEAVQICGADGGAPATDAPAAGPVGELVDAGEA